MNEGKRVQIEVVTLHIIHDSALVTGNGNSVSLNLVLEIYN